MLEHAQLRAILPHRYPMLLLDRVLAVTPGASLTAVKAVTGCEPCYRALPDGLPPERYAYPVSLMLESFGQAAAVLWLLSAGDRSAGDRSAGDRPAGDADVLMLAVVRDFQLHGEAYPGDVLRHEVRLDHALDGAGIGVGEIFVGDRRIAAVGSLLAVVRPSQSLLPAAALAAPI
jgi:3-hydroxyacyl-[acyl-carrier-protein] dehydratase